MSKSGIYKIQSICKPDRIYIGSAKNFTNRKSLHKSTLRKNKHCNIKLQRHFDKYGENDLEFSLVLECPFDELIINEQKFIDEINPYFNICKTAGSSLGCTGHKMTEENRKKLLEVNKGNKYGLSRIKSEEERLEISNRRKGIKHTQETKEKISNSKKGQASRLGATLSEESKRKMSESLKQAWMKRRANVKVVY